MKPRVSRYRIHSKPSADQKAGATPEHTPPAKPLSPEAEVEAVKQEGLTARQLRMARRVAQKHGLMVNSDYDAVRQLRAQNIDPFQRSNVLELVVPAEKKKAEKAEQPEPKPQPQPKRQAQTNDGKVQLPSTVKAPAQSLPSTEMAQPSAGMDERAGEIRQMQQEIARRRRRNLMLLGARLAFFILLPTLLAGFYFFAVATPMYSTKSEFIIQKADGAATGMGGLLQGTSMANQQDSITVQSHLSSLEAMLKLDEDEGFRSVFSADNVDMLQRLDPNASQADAYDVYKKRVRLSYDPTEGLVRMEVSAPDPQVSLAFSNALIVYAEQKVESMTARVREDQMRGAEESYREAEAGRMEALENLTRVQSEAEVLDPMAENTALMSRITGLETQRDSLVLELNTLLDNRRPNRARVDAARAGIDRLDAQIASLRSQITTAQLGRQSQTMTAARLREAEENYQFRLALVQEALAQREAARIEANRQVRYLEMSVTPIAPDAPSYPKALENTVLAFFIFSGIYLMMSLTAAVLREQISA